jgi:hypothetical protein
VVQVLVQVGVELVFRHCLMGQVHSSAAPRPNLSHTPEQ